MEGVDGESYQFVIGPHTGPVVMDDGSVEDHQFVGPGLFALVIRFNLMRDEETLRTVDDPLVIDARVVASYPDVETAVQEEIEKLIARRYPETVGG